MEHIGIDVHARGSRFCRLTESSEILEQRPRTRPDRFAEVLGDRPRAQILTEGSTESEWAAGYVVRRLETRPNIGPFTALSFVATVDRVERFRGPHPAAAQLGLVQGERSSREQQRRGPIAIRGHRRTRWRRRRARSR